MNTILEILTAVVNSLWQEAAVAALVWIALRYWPRTNAATRYAIWWATLAVVLILPIAPRWIAMVRPHRQNVASKTVERAAPIGARPTIRFEPVIIAAAPGRAAQWPIAVVALWAAILAWRLWQIARSYLYLRGVKRRSTVSAIPLPGIRRRADLLISADIVSPMAVGFLSPAVVLPESLIEELSETEREHVLLHEAAHLARQDDWGNLAMRMLGGALALHPVAIWILHRIEREREIACDDWVVARTGAARPYAVSLARLFELRRARREQMLASGIFGSGSCFGERMEMLLRRRRAYSERVSAALLSVCAMVLCGLMLAGALAPHWIAFAQSARRSFEVASVKPADTDDLRTSIEIQPGARFVASATLKALIGFAYDVQDRDILGGPGWSDSSAYRINAAMGAVAPQSTETALREMLQSLLAERFKLSVRRESHDEAVYELQPAKGGPRLKEALSSGPPRLSNGRGRIGGQSAGMGMLARMLAGRVGRVVIDKTGLKGTYDFELSWAPVPGERDDGAIAGAPANPDGPTLFTALQEQLGLRLQSGRGPVEVLVIDRAEKPDAN